MVNERDFFDNPETTNSASPVSTIGICPLRNIEIFTESMSRHTTVWPREEKQAPVASPT